MGKTKLDETYIFKISIKMRFFWCSYWYQNSFFYSFVYYWAGSLLTTVRYHKLFDTRRCDNLVVDIHNSVRSGFTLKYVGPSVKNSLPVNVREAKHFPQFEKRLEEFLLGNIFLLGGGGVRMGCRAGGRSTLKGLGWRELYWMRDVTLGVFERRWFFFFFIIILISGYL